MKLNKTTRLAIAAALLGAIIAPSMAFAAKDKNPVPTEINLTIKPDNPSN